MNEDVLDDVLRFSGNTQEALSTAPEVLRHSLECAICNSLMVSPFAMTCGHTFCGTCAALWMRERRDDPTCPVCRSKIQGEPVPSIPLRQIALAVVSAWNASQPPENQVPPEKLVAQSASSLFVRSQFRAPVWDSEDDVYRCPDCNHEIEDDGACSGCRRYFATLDAEHDEDYEPEYDAGEILAERRRQQQQPIISSRTTWRGGSAHGWSRTRDRQWSDDSGESLDMAYNTALHSDLDDDDEMDSEDRAFVVDDDEEPEEIDEEYVGRPDESGDSEEDEEMAHQWPVMDVGDSSALESADDDAGAGSTVVNRSSSSRPIIVDDGDDDDTNNNDDFEITAVRTRPIVVDDDSD